MVNRPAMVAAASSGLLVLALLFSGCRGNEEQRVGHARTAPGKVAKTVPNLIGMPYKEAKTRFLQAGGELVRAKPKASSEARDTVIGQQPPPGERFIHSIELVVARPFHER